MLRSKIISVLREFDAATLGVKGLATTTHKIDINPDDMTRGDALAIDAEEQRNKLLKYVSDSSEDMSDISLKKRV